MQWVMAAPGVARRTCRYAGSGLTDLLRVARYAAPTAVQRIGLEIDAGLAAQAATRLRALHAVGEQHREAGAGQPAGQRAAGRAGAEDEPSWPRLLSDLGAERKRLARSAEADVALGRLDALVERADLPGVLGNCHASGTTIIAELGDEHVRTGKPIFYTSADSVFQVACHEEAFDLQRLYDLCDIARELVDEYRIGRVIARPFVGDGPDTYVRTGNRRDLTTPPHAPTVLDKLVAKGGEVISIGKIADIYAHKGITRKVKASGNEALFDATLSEINTAGDDTIIFTNFVDFDMLYGHRRDVDGRQAAEAAELPA